MFGTIRVTVVMPNACSHFFFHICPIKFHAHIGHAQAVPLELQYYQLALLLNPFFY